MYSLCAFERLSHGRVWVVQVKRTFDDKVVEIAAWGVSRPNKRCSQTVAFRIVASSSSKMKHLVVAAPDHIRYVYLPWDLI